MPHRHDRLAKWFPLQAPHLGAVLLAFCACTFMAGCPSSINKQAVALSTATAPVVDQAAAAYRQAQAIHSLRVDYDAAAAFDQSNVFVPGTIQTWPSDKEIEVRLQVLAAFQLYVKNVVAITNGTDSPALDEASQSLGSSLTGLTNTLAPTAETAVGITPAAASTTTTTVTTASAAATSTTTTTASTPAPLISAATQRGVTLAIDALGQFLISRTIQKDLPPKIVAMDPHVKTLCELLANDVSILREQEKLDSNDVIDKQTDFIRDGKLDPEARRNEFMKLPDMARRQQANDQQLATLRDAIVHLELAHHALAADAQGNNPSSLKGKLADLESAGESLGKLSSSLSTAQK
jgi:hypothetical protein